MAQNCPVRIQFQFCSKLEKFIISAMDVTHQNHPVSEKHEQLTLGKKKNNGDGQPVAKFFIKEETTESISACLKVFSENNDVSVTKVTITDKDCAEIAALAKFFTASTHILCHFHVLKAVDAKLATFKGLSKEQKQYIREKFRSDLYATTQAEFDSAYADLMKLEKNISNYFRENWFNISEKWSYLGRQHLPTFGNDTTNRLERFNHTIEYVLQKTRRLPEVIWTLVNIVLLRLSDREMKQNIKELQFSTKSKHPLLQNFANSISPYAWRKLEGELKIMKNQYDFIFNKELSCYCITSRNKQPYQLRHDLSGCSCHFFVCYGLPCRHIISFHIKDNIEIPVGAFLEHWQNQCLEDLFRGEKLALEVLIEENTALDSSSTDIAVLSFEGMKSVSRSQCDKSIQGMLFLDKVEQLTKTNRLSSGFINRAMQMLSQQHADIGGLYCCTLVLR
ncbi:hypothetical protein DAPPUDRAFT_116791 [Daphnia pulex]|uniref:SWIM-type domain-containing protein n=1 Tax=Daphnia pulex TaxID=6669 RepID=E9HQI7_DAPPU|nr:hypothetical protein DAPPUDRAFT_116791 [Daphnia pulex]|eukprot:EFX65973.1 hypothetical protein DAPPUDRAFT_116791 [Daphnia pulex]